MQLSRILYYSDAVVMDGAGLRRLLTASRANNERNGITGFLFFDRTYFVQVIEGEREQVSRLYHTIAVDPRHRGIILISAEEADERAFPTWFMGLRDGVDENTNAIFAEVLGSERLDPKTVSGPQLLEAMQRIALDVLKQMAEADES